MQEEKRFKHEKSESTHFVSTSKDKSKKRKKDEVAKGPDQKNLKKMKIVSFLRNLDT